MKSSCLLAAAIAAAIVAAPVSAARPDPAAPVAAASSAPAAAKPLGPKPKDPEQLQRWMQAFVAQLTPQTGTVDISAAKARIALPAGYVFYPAAQARQIMEQAWENPPTETTLGLLMPKGVTPFDNGAWAVEITYEGDGHVDDGDAKSINYADLLKTIQKDAEDQNPERKKQGYDTLHIVGWAKTPYYDAANHKLHWAKLLSSDDFEGQTLNYNIRVLGREGVLVMNFIAAKEQLAAIDKVVPEVLASTNFNQGSRYADYDAKTDKLAGYGIAALIGGAAIAQKTGLLAGLLIFGKKGIALLIATGVWLANKLRGSKKGDGDPA